MADTSQGRREVPCSSVPCKLRNFLLFAGHKGTAEPASRAPLKRPILVKLCNAKQRGGFPCFPAPQTENIFVLSPYDCKTQINFISLYQLQLHFCSAGLRLGQSLLQCDIPMQEGTCCCHMLDEENSQSCSCPFDSLTLLQNVNIRHLLVLKPGLLSAGRAPAEPL